MSVNPPEPPALQSVQSADALYGRVVTRGRRLRRERWAFLATAGTAVIILAAAIPIALSSDGGERVATTDQPETTHPAPVTTTTTSPLTTEPGVLSETTTTLTPVAVAGETTTPTTKKPASRVVAPPTTRRPNPTTTSPPTTAGTTTTIPGAGGNPPSPCTPTTPLAAAAPNQVVFARDGDLWSGADPTTNVNLTGTAAAEASPAWSPDRTRIAFVRDGDVWTMTPTPGDPGVRVTSGVDVDAAPAWSWDGQTIAFTRGGDIWLANSNGGNEQFAINLPEPVFSPTWSPDSCKVAFVWKGSLYTARTDGTGVFQVRAAALEPSWGSNNRIAYSAIVGNTRDVFSTLPGGTGPPARVTTGGASNPSWSRDAGQIAFQSARVPGQGQDVFTQPAGGGTLAPVTTDPADDTDPTW
jgi:hypothetical protein